MTRALLTRAATICFFAFALASCRSKRSPPPPVAVVPVVPPPPTATPDPLASALEDMPVVPTTWHYVQAVGVNDSSILISVDVGSPIAMPTTSNVPPPPGTTAQVQYLVIDLARGCVVETETFPMVDAAASRIISPSEMTASLGSMAEFFGDAGKPNERAAIEDVTVGPARVLPIANSPIFHDQFARKQELFAAFGATSDEHTAWSRDGTRAMLAADDGMYRSDDGIHFSSIDLNAAYRPMVTSDGRFGIYRRCTHPCGDYRLAQITLGQKSTPRFVAAAEVHDYAFDPDGQSVVYAREDKSKNRICIERVTLSQGTVTKIACEPTAEVISENILTMSENTAFGALETYQGPSKDPQLVIFDLKNAVRVRSIPAMSNVPPVANDGAVALDDAPSIDATRIWDDAGPHGIGAGEALAWDTEHRVVLFHRAALADPSKCGVVTAVGYP